MNKNQTFRRIKRIFILSFFIFAIHGTFKAQNADVIVIDAYKPTISDAFKINDNPEIRDTVVEKLNLDYRINPKLYPTTFEVDPIKPAKMIGEPLIKLYKTYVKAGFGNKSTPLAEFYFNNLRSTGQSFGVYFKHLSSSGNIKNYAFPGFSNNEAGIYVHKFYKKHTLSADIDYNRNLVHYYGFRPKKLSPELMVYADNKDSIKQRFLKAGGQLEYASTYNDSTKINHSFSLTYFSFSDLYKAAEDYVGFNVSLDKNVNLIGKNVKNQDIGIKADVDYYDDINKTDTAESAVIRLLPHFSAAYDILKFDIGLNASVQDAEDSKIFFYPDVNININLYNNIFLLYGGLTGGLKKNNLIDFTSENPFVNTSLPLAFTNTKSKVIGGMKGSLSSYLSFNVYISKSNIENLPLFVTDTTGKLLNKFTVIYDKAKVLNTHTEITYQKTEKIKFMLVSNFYQYYMDSEVEAWHKPSMDVKCSLNYNLKDKIIVTVDAIALNSAYAKVYSPGNIPDMNPVRLKGTVDFNLGLEYRYTKILSAFINLNNMGDLRYQHWYNYPGYGFTVLAGVTCAF